MMCLVLAMSGTSALLNWIDQDSRSDDRQRGLTDHATTPDAFALSPEQIDLLVQSVVAEAVDLRPGRWTSVDVVAGPPVGERTQGEYSTLLAAQPSRTDVHFRIDERGRPFATGAWLRQIALAPDPSAISVQVTRRGEGRPMTPIQWLCVRSLIAELSTLRQSRQVDGVDRIAERTWPAEAQTGWGDRAATALPVRLHEDWSDASSTGKRIEAPFRGTMLQLAAKADGR